MIKVFKKVVSLVLAVVFVFGITACANNSPSSNSSKKKIGILAPAVTHGWVAGTTYYSEQRCKELGDTIQYRISTSSNAEEMTAQLDDMKQWGADAIVIYPQWSGMEVAVAQAISDGIPVVSFDIDIDAQGAYLVTGDNKSMGVAGAEYIVGKIGKTGTVVFLDVPTSASVAQLRKEGFYEKMSEIAPDMKIIAYATKMTREDGLSDFADILASNEKVDAVFSMDDEISMGVLQAIREANRTDVKAITGGGGCQEYFKLMQENPDIWLESSLYSPAMIKDAIDVAVDILDGKATDTKKIISTSTVDRDNCNEYIDSNNTVY